MRDGRCLCKQESRRLRLRREFLAAAHLIAAQGSRPALEEGKSSSISCAVYIPPVVLVRDLLYSFHFRNCSSEGHLKPPDDRI